jgi:hypothetical protein
MVVRWDEGYAGSMWCSCAKHEWKEDGDAQENPHDFYGGIAIDRIIIGDTQQNPELGFAND